MYLNKHTILSDIRLENALEVFFQNNDLKINISNCLDVKNLTEKDYNQLKLIVENLNNNGEAALTLIDINLALAQHKK